MWTEHGIWGTMSNSVWLSMEEVNEPWGWRSQMDRLEKVVLKGPVQNLSFDWWSLFPGGWWHHLICFSAEQCFSVLAAHQNNMGSFKKKKKILMPNAALQFNQARIPRSRIQVFGSFKKLSRRFQCATKAENHWCGELLQRRKKLWPEGQLGDYWRPGEVLQGSGFPTSVHQDHLEALWTCWAPAPSFKRSRVRPKNLHFWPFPRWCQCCWCRDFILRTTGLWPGCGMERRKRTGRYFGGRERGSGNQLNGEALILTKMGAEKAFLFCLWYGREDDWACRTRLICREDLGEGS